MEENRKDIQEEIREEKQEESPEVIPEEKLGKKKKSILENCLFWIAVAVWLVIVGAIGYFFVALFQMKVEASENYKKYSENFENLVKKYYGLEKADYDIKDLDLGGVGKKFGYKPVYEFTVGEKMYYAAGTGEYLSTSYYSEEFRNAATARVRETLDASGVFGDTDYQIENLTFVFKEMKEEVLDVHTRNEYTTRVKSGALLAVWVNRDELERFKTLAVDRDRWFKEIFVYVTVKVDTENAMVFSEEDLLSLSADLFYVEELTIHVGNDTWVYRPKAGQLAECPLMDYNAQ